MLSAAFPTSLNVKSFLTKPIYSYHLYLCQMQDFLKLITLLFINCLKVFIFRTIITFCNHLHLRHIQNLINCIIINTIVSQIKFRLYWNRFNKKMFDWAKLYFYTEMFLYESINHKIITLPINNIWYIIINWSVRTCR